MLRAHCRCSVKDFGIELNLMDLPVPQFLNCSCFYFSQLKSYSIKNKFKNMYVMSIFQLFSCWSLQYLMLLATPSWKLFSSSLLWFP